MKNSQFYSQQINLPSMKEVELLLKSDYSLFNLPEIYSNSVKEEEYDATDNNDSVDNPNIIRIELSPIEHDLIDDLPIVWDETDHSNILMSPNTDLLVKSLKEEIQYESSSTKTKSMPSQNASKNLNEIKTNYTDALIELDSSSNKSKKRTIAFKSHSTACYSEWLATRWDVVYKTILRDFHRHFQTKFKEGAAFTKRNKSRTYSQKLHEFTEGIINKYFPNDSEVFKVTEWVEALITPIKNSEFHSCLYKFSIQKAMRLMKNRIYYKLFQAYCEQIQNGEIETPSTISKNWTVYQFGYEMLLKEGQSFYQL